ncbi:hypothetical protein L0128_14615, partial [candidate division KSB1 bacterium]|nr:hypothetical protein [candidate division KSB1 bacterium]
FEILGGNLFVMHRDGTGLTDLGKGHRPQWAPDNGHLVYMQTTDDGMNYLASDLFSVHRNGQEKTPLTTTTKHLEMNPHWSPDGSKIVFDRFDEGAIYLLELQF